MEFMLLVSLIVIVILATKVIVDYTEIKVLGGKVDVCESEHEKLMVKFLRKEREYSEVVDYCNTVIKAHNKLVEQKRQGFNKQQFNQEDLKRMKHYLHPDKHSGKTNDLFIKVNESLK